MLSGEMGGKSVVALILACAVGLLVACGGGGGGVDSPSNTNQSSSTDTNQQQRTDQLSPPPPSFTSYLSDAAVEGVEYSGSAGNGVTGEGGVFTVGVGVIRFFIGGTTLGSVQINENWDNAHLTPADFMGVDMDGVISITRILQGLDEDGNPQNGISISQTARSGAQNLFDDLTESGAIAVINSKTYNIPSADEAMRHFVATRRCIFSGVYAGVYKATVGADISDERPGYFIFEPFANRARGEFSTGNDFELMSVAITVGETRSVVTLSAGNELDFVTPRLVTGIWSSGTVSGTNRFTLLAGDPRATLRIVGIEIDEGRTVSGLYALDYFDFDDSFRGQYYDVETDKISALSYDLQGGAWPAAMMTANLTLRGNDVITLEFVRKDDNYGEFEGIGDYDGLSGTWCDFGGSGKPIAPIAPVTPITPATPIAATQSDSAISITWSAVAEATHYKLYRSATRGGSFARIGGDIIGTDYVDDSDLAANTTYYYQLESCNDNGCSDRSREVSATTAPATPLNPTAAAQSDDTISITWSAVADATHYKLYRATVSGGLLTPIGGEIATTEYVDRGLDANTSYYYRLESCNDNGCSGRSPEVSATTYPAAPDAPEIPTADTQSDSEIEISWSEVARAMHYKLYRSTVSGGSYSQTGGDIAATRYRDSALSVKTAYYYQLEACNSGGCSGRSPEVAASTYGSLGAARDEITAGLTDPRAIAFSGGRAYVVDSEIDKIISYPVEEDGGLGAGRDEITTGLFVPRAIAFSGGRAYVADFIKNKIISYAVEEGGNLGAGRDEITSGLLFPSAIAFSGGRVYVAAGSFPGEIISYAVEEGGSLGAARDEITTDLPLPSAIAFSGGRAYVVDANLDKIISYPEGVNGSLGAGRDEITTGLSFPSAIAFSGGRAYVADIDLAKIISYAVDVNGSLGAGRDEITTGLDQPFAIAFSGERVYVADIDLAKIISYPLFSPVSFAVAPDAPRVFAQSDSEIEIAWNAVLGATHYKLYRSATSGGLFTPIGGDISVTRYRDDDFSGDAFYYYQLEACSDGECSGRSPAVGTVPATPSTPTAATQSDSAISIRWSEAAGATHYKLYRSETSEGSFTQIGGNITATDYIDNNDLAANTSYYYQVESCNDNGCSGRSPEISATTAPATPSMPATPTASAQSESAISLSWSAVAGATHYKLYRSETSEGSFDQIGGDIAATDYVDASDLAANTSYYYQLESCNDNGCSSRSSAVSATTAPERPETPTTATQSEGAISIRWSEAAGATHYKLYRSATSEGSFAQIGGDITGTDYVDAIDLAASTSYYYQLESCNGNGCSSRSSAVSATTAPERPETPTIATQSEGAISISWSAVAGVTHYKLYRSATSEGSFTQIGGDITGIDYVDESGLAANTSYYYQLESCNGNGCSSRSSAVSATTTPERPSALTVAAQSKSAISISWSAVAGATHYKLYRSATSEGSFTQIGGEIAGTDYVDDNDLAANTSYYYQLAACSGNGCSSRSSAVSATTAPETPETPTAAAQSKSAISISWSAVAGATHYKLYRSETRDGSFMQIGGEITATDYVDSDISASASYYYQLEACNDNGCSGRSLEVSTAIHGSLGEPRDEVVSGLGEPFLIALSSKRAYVVDNRFNDFHVIISYPVEANGILGEARNEITVDFVGASAFSGGRLYLGENFLEEESPSKIISYPVGADGVLGAARDEITTGLFFPTALAFSGERAYVVDDRRHKIISYPVGADGSLGESRDEITTGLNRPLALAFSGGRAYVTDIDGFSNEDKIISYAVGAGGILGARRDEITTGLTGPTPLAFSGGRVYVLDDGGKIISYAVGADGSLGESRDEITTGLNSPVALAFSGGRVYVVNFTGKVISYPLFSSVPFAVVPDAPRVFAQSESEIEIAWNTVLGATHYKLYRSETSGGLFAPVGGEISVTRYLDSGPANIFYYYQLEACSGNECSGRSPAVGTAPAMPSPMAATQSDSAISITWSAVTGATHYKLYRSETSGGSFDQIGGNIAATDYVDDSGLTANTPYYYQLEACNDNGCSGRPLEVSATTAPAMPLNLTATAQSDDAVSITWSAVAGATHYKLYRSEMSGGSFDQIGRDITATDYVDDSGLTANTPYYYQLEACNDNGCSGRSLETSAATAPPTAPPAAPTAPDATPQNAGEIEIRWSEVARATHYKLYRSETSGESFDQIGGDITGVRYADSDLFADTAYYYELEACNSGGCSGRSSEVSATTYPAAPDAPEIPTADTQSDSEIEISWSEVARAMHYKLYRSTVSGGSYSQIGGDIAAISYRDSGLSVKTAYYYQLEACNSGGCSGRSPEVAASTYGSLGAARDEITSLFSPRAIAFSGGRAYVADENLDKIISYPVGANGKLGESRDEITIGLISPTALAFSGGRAYVADRDFSRDSDKIISYAVEANGKLGESRDEITTGLRLPSAIAFSGGRAYVADRDLRRDNDKIISYAVEANGKLGESRDEITTGLSSPEGIAIAGGRVYVADANLDKIISYAVGADGSLGESRDEITTDLRLPSAIAFSGGRAYVADAILDKIISYAVGTDGSLGESRDEITTDLLDPRAIAFSDGRVYVADRDLNKIISYPLIRISPPAAPDAPRIVAHSGSEVEIPWNAVSGATHYKLYRSETSGGLFESIGGDISVTRYRDSGLYYYQLEACNSGGCSGHSFEAACDGSLGVARDETGGLGRPYGIAISDGRAYVADRDLGKIISYPVGEDGSLGVALDEITTGLMRPAGIAITGGRVYVVDIGLDKIISYPVEEDGGLGAGRDEITTGLSSPFGIAIAGGRVYVANQGFSNIISYPVGEDGKLGAARNEVMTRSSVPVVIAIAGGRAYVADFHLDKITSYPVETDGELGAGRDEITTGLQEPVGIAIAGNRVYVTGGGLTNGRRNNSKIISYPVNADGSLGAARDEIIVDLNFPVGIAIAGGRVYVADADITGGEDRIVSYPVGEDGELGAARDETTIVDFLRGGIAIAGGRTYLTDGGQDKIISYPVGADGGLGAARDEITTALSSPEGIAIAGGRAYVADSNLNKIISYPVREDGSLGAARDEITTGLSQPRAVAIAGGRAYVTDEFRSKIFSYPVGENGELGAVREEAKAGFISRLRSIVFSGRRAYVADPGPDRIVSYPVNADGSLGAPRDEITTGLNFPSGVAIASGRAYVTEYETDLRSREVRGKIISYPVEAGGELGAARDETTIGLSSPGDIAIAGGRVYVKDFSLRKIISYPFCSI